MRPFFLRQIILDPLTNQAPVLELATSFLLLEDGGYLLLPDRISKLIIDIDNVAATESDDAFFYLTEDGKGLYIVDKADPATLMRGVNFGNLFWPLGTGGPNGTDYLKTPVTDADYIKLVAAGIDHVRLPLSPSVLFINEPNYTIFDNSVIQLVDKFIADATRFGLSIIVDVHPRSFEYTDVYNGIAQIWFMLATRYKDFPKNVVFELLNEPNPDVFTNAGMYKSWHVNAYNAIRKIDPNRRIIIDSQYSGYPTGFNNITPLFDKNTTYSFHYYNPFSFSHQGATFQIPSGLLNNVAYPTNPDDIDAQYENVAPNSNPPERSIQFNRKFIRDEIANNPVAWADRYGIPRNRLYCGELGVYDQSTPHPDRQYWYRDVISALNELGVGYCLWTYTGDFPTGPEILQEIK